MIDENPNPTAELQYENHVINLKIIITSSSSCVLMTTLLIEESPLCIKINLY